MNFEFSNLRTLCASTSASSITSHGDGLLEFLHILEVLDGAVDLPAVDGLGSLTGVLEADTKIAATAASRFGTGDTVGGGVADLHVAKASVHYFSCKFGTISKRASHRHRVRGRRTILSGV